MISEKEKRANLENAKFLVLLVGVVLGVFSWSMGFTMMAIPIFVGTGILFIVFWRVLEEGQENYSET